MTSDTHDTHDGSITADRSAVIEGAVKHLGHAISARRSLLGIRQTDLSERTGIQSSQISRVESGSTNARLSTIIVLLDELGILKDLLDVLKTHGANEFGERVGIPKTAQTSDVMHKPLSTGQFLALFDHNPAVELPVSTRASLELRKRGFAVRRSEHETLGTTNYVTAVSNARYSEHKYLTEEGEIGGYKHLSVIVAGANMTDEQADVAPVVLDVIKNKINEAIDSFKLHVAAIEFDANATAHVVRSQGKAIESAYIYDKVCEVINNAAEWMPL